MLRYKQFFLVLAGALALILVTDARMSVAADDGDKKSAANAPATFARRAVTSGCRACCGTCRTRDSNPASNGISSRVASARPNASAWL